MWWKWRSLQKSKHLNNLLTFVTQFAHISFWMNNRFFSPVPLSWLVLVPPPEVPPETWLAVLLAIIFRWLSRVVNRWLALLFSTSTSPNRVCIAANLVSSLPTLKSWYREHAILDRSATTAIVLVRRMHEQLFKFRRNQIQNNSSLSRVVVGNPLRKISDYSITSKISFEIQKMCFWEKTWTKNFGILSFIQN